MSPSIAQTLTLLAHFRLWEALVVSGYRPSSLAILVNSTSWQFSFPVVFSQHILVLARSVLVGGEDDHFYTTAELEKPQRLLRLKPS